MEKHKLKRILILIAPIVGVMFLSFPCFATEPVIYSVTPQFIQQGQTTNAVITGENLTSSSISLSGGDVFAVILRQDSDGMALTVQFSASSVAQAVERTLTLRTATQQVATFPLSVIPAGAPFIENVYPNILTPGSTNFLYVRGQRLNNPVVSSESNDIVINSYRESGNDGELVFLSLTVKETATPGRYNKIFLNTLGGFSQYDLFVSDQQQPASDTSNFDPYSAWISSVENSDGHFVIKGSQFNPDDTVTLLENKEGTIISRPLPAEYISSDELVVSLPEDITNIESISFAVSSKDGRASNIKQLANNSVSNTDQTGTDQSTDSTSDSNTDTTVISGNNNDNSSAADKNNDESMSDNIATENNTETSTQTDTTNTANLPPQINDDDLKNVTQILYGNNEDDIYEEKIALNQLDKPNSLKNILNSIEENKQSKNQSDLLSTAISEAQKIEDKKLHEAIKKSEELKSKVEELEKLLKTEENKNQPDRRKLANYKKLLETANAESRSQTFELLNNLLKYKPNLKYLLSQKPFDLAAIQPNIPADAVVLQYVPTEEGLIIFVVDSDNLKVRVNKNITKEQLNKDVKSYRLLLEKEIEKVSSTGRVTPINSWKKSNTVAYKQTIKPLKRKTSYLYNALIKPIESDISSKSTIAIISNGWLRYLPFQSLGKPLSNGDLDFIVSNKSIVYLDSVLALSRPHPLKLNEKPNITVFANPDGSLAGANNEAEIISMLYSTSTKTLVQKPFNKNLINQIASKSDILHLATHGHFNSSNIGSSYLITGNKKVGPKTEKEKLYLKDIYDLNLKNSKLVVLSGCDTGKLGNLSDEPDDLLGSLASAFRVAGANTIVASLWFAHDEATKLMMQNFYKNLKLGMNKGEALRKAQIAVKNNPKYSHPLFWSLFNIIGDWR